jgi:hypothetical protein
MGLPCFPMKKDPNRRHREFMLTSPEFRADSSDFLSNFRSPDIGIHTNVRFSVRFHSFQPHLRQAGIADSFGSPSQGQIHWAIRSVAYRSRPCRIWNPKMPEKKSGQFWVPAPSIGNPIKMRSSKLYVRSSEFTRFALAYRIEMLIKIR